MEVLRSIPQMVKLRFRWGKKPSKSHSYKEGGFWFCFGPNLSLILGDTAGIQAGMGQGEDEWVSKVQMRNKPGSRVLGKRRVAFEAARQGFCPSEEVLGGGGLVGMGGE